MTTNKHFEDLWEEGEKLYTPEQTDTQNLLEVLSFKIELYKKIDLQDQLSYEDKSAGKSQVMGEILVSLTRLSMKDNINVFAALSTALQTHKVMI